MPKSSNPRNNIRQSTLLIGSSILKNVKTEELTDKTAVRTYPGATIEYIETKLSELNSDQCNTVIIQVGGNGADNGVGLDSFQEKYEHLLNTVCDGTRRVIVSGLLPREAVNLQSYNETLKSLCADNAVEFVENYSRFLFASSEMTDALFHKDKVHISTRELLSNINKLHQVTRTFQEFKSKPFVQRYRSSSRNMAKATNFRQFRSPTKYCHICSRTGGHSTQECWYNGRNHLPPTPRRPPYSTIF